MLHKRRFREVQPSLVRIYGTSKGSGIEIFTFSIQTVDRNCGPVYCQRIP
jgi:hypothetical protein